MIERKMLCLQYELYKRLIKEPWNRIKNTAPEISILSLKEILDKASFYGGWLDKCFCGHLKGNLFRIQTAHMKQDEVFLYKYDSSGCVTEYGKSNSTADDLTLSSVYAEKFEIKLEDEWLELVRFDEGRKNEYRGVVEPGNSFHPNLHTGPDTQWMLGNYVEYHSTTPPPAGTIRCKRWKIADMIILK